MGSLQRWWMNRWIFCVTVRMNRSDTSITHAAAAYCFREDEHALAEFSGGEFVGGVIGISGPACEHVVEA